VSEAITYVERLPLELEPVSPFRLDLTVWTLRRRPDNVVDRWDGETYRRVLVADDGKPFEVAVAQSGSSDAPHLCVSISREKSNIEVKEQAILALERLLGINLNLDGFYRMAECDDKLKPLADQFRGFKPPRFQTYFETLVNAISCQQLTLTVGIRLLNGLAEKYGPALKTEDGVFHAFPRPQDLANVDIEELRKMSFSYQKARYITGLAQLIIQKQLDFEEIESLDDQNAVDRLCSIKGVGRWTAEYFLLRGLGRTHIFPADDVGARNHLQRWLGLPEKLNYAEIHEALKRWKGYGGLVYFHLLLKSLLEKSVIVN
jgi:DNA-3-methyladenine glycosylase II